MTEVKTLHLSFSSTLHLLAQAKYLFISAVAVGYWTSHHILISYQTAQYHFLWMFSKGPWFILLFLFLNHLNLFNTDTKYDSIGQCCTDVLYTHIDLNVNACLKIRSSLFLYWCSVVISDGDCVCICHTASGITQYWQYWDNLNVLWLLKDFPLEASLCLWN